MNRPSASAAAREAAQPARGFTLLEVMIAMSILALALVAVAGINSGAISMHTYAKQLTVATLLARGKMADIESKLQAEGLPTDDDEEDGNFSEEGYPQYAWSAQIIRPKTEDIDVAGLMSMAGVGLEGLAGGAGGLGDLAKNLPPEAQAALNQAGGPSALAGAAGAGAAGLAGLAGGAMQTQLQTMLDDLGKTVREVRLTVLWKNGKQVEKFTVVTHVVSLGPGTDQAQSDPAAAAAAAGATPGVGPDGKLIPVSPNGLNRVLGPGAGQGPNPRIPGLNFQPGIPGVNPAGRAGGGFGGPFTPGGR